MSALYTPTDTTPEEQLLLASLDESSQIAVVNIFDRRFAQALENAYDGDLYSDDLLIPSGPVLAAAQALLPSDDNLHLARRVKEDLEKENTEGVIEVEWQHDEPGFKIWVKVDWAKTTFRNAWLAALDRAKSPVAESKTEVPNAG